MSSPKNGVNTSSKLEEKESVSESPKKNEFITFFNAP